MAQVKIIYLDGVTEIYTYEGQAQISYAEGIGNVSFFENGQWKTVAQFNAREFRSATITSDEELTVQEELATPDPDSTDLNQSGVAPVKAPIQVSINGRIYNVDAYYETLPYEEIVRLVYGGPVSQNPDANPSVVWHHENGNTYGELVRGRSIKLQPGLSIDCIFTDRA